VKILAACVCNCDQALRRAGRIPGPPRAPFTPGTAIVGVVDEVGEGIGRRSARDLVPVAADLDTAETVCLVIDYLIAPVMLHPGGTSRLVGLVPVQPITHGHEGKAKTKGCSERSEDGR
jgi:NADPH:quinone reductase-like Zn-dependent oxidoreductase